jgi:DnaA family protein
MNAQLPLALRWPAQQRFDTFVPGAANGTALALLRAAAQTADAPWVFVAGPAGSAKTHLLLAACAAASATGRAAQYLSLATLSGDRAVALHAFGGSALLALDDVHALSGDRAAEHALFDLYNRCKTEQATLLFAALAPPAQLGVTLPDLVSRLSACAQATLKPLDADARRALLRERAQARGLVLDAAALDWLFAHTPRDLGSLMAQLERIDSAALAAQRRVTVPFLRGLLGGGT